ncbi:hypothetical protein OG777_24910 [Micromonospora peucetia]|uniref:Uncharacterized protein n=1 Tax=Micromonospora peucetia TaxID=47871 RepID=A0A1C6W4C2_9ACTN|nr:hypothetical protein [Micromonospora peucetia]MCX4390139.1 hypothetical protein [Micromonospora peucetia]SCL73415.1 hypothetical protein GA0070608_5696 [Micromonospora peucetia]
MRNIDQSGVAMDHDDLPLEEWPLRQAARDLAKDSPEGRSLKRRLEAFDDLDDVAKKNSAQDIRKDIADIVARAVTEEHHRTEMLDALIAFRNQPGVAESDPAEIQDQHPLVAGLLDVAQDIITELGKEALIETLLPGAHLILPPNDFVESLFTAVELLEIAEDPADSPWWP